MRDIITCTDGNTYTGQIFMVPNGKYRTYVIDTDAGVYTISRENISEIYYMGGYTKLHK
jgi:hypothetical protein